MVFIFVLLLDTFDMFSFTSTLGIVSNYGVLSNGQYVTNGNANPYLNSTTISRRTKNEIAVGVSEPGEAGVASDTK